MHQCVSSGAFQQWQVDRLQGPEDSSKKDDLKEDKIDKRDERRKKATGGKGGGGTQVGLILLEAFLKTNIGLAV